MACPDNARPGMALKELLELHPTPVPAASLAIVLRRGRRPHVELLSRVPHSRPEYSGTCEQWFGVLRACCGDAPDKVHPKFLFALLSSRAALQANRNPDGTWPPLPDWRVPSMQTGTDDFVRVAMTLNGMRMATEYFGSGSTRVLRLVRQRLEAGQHDVVHDILVYLSNQILDIRAEAAQARALRAEAVAAYLGLDQQRTAALFQQTRLSPPRLARQIKLEAAGPLRRRMDVEALLQSQFEHLQPALKAAIEAEKRVLRLVDRIVALLY